MERWMTLGVAGHVDHGKTSLVKCLTGVDTDRMKAEKTRGLSIEAGIAPWIMEDGLSLALVDVPGHTDFLKNTVRGLSGVDLAMLVVAADDGVMPQTLEHLETLHYLGSSAGFVVISKADLVDGETLELAEMEIRDLARGTFLEGKQVISFSSLDGRGAQAVRESALSEARLVSARSADGPFRLWVDQVRHVNGFGTVVSGTVAEGRITRDDPLQILPSRKITRARFLECHGKRVDRAWAGQRVGINLHNVTINEAGRGMLLTCPDSVSVALLINTEVHVREKLFVPIQNRMKVKLYIGTLMVTAMAVIMGRDRLGPGESGRVQFRLSRSVPVRPRDRFVVSLMNVNRIVGGGIVLEIPSEKYTAARFGKVEPLLAALKEDNVTVFVEKTLSMSAARPVTLEMLRERSGIETGRMKEVLLSLTGRGLVLDFGDKGYFPADRFREVMENVLAVAREALSKGRLKSRVNAKEILAAMGSPLSEDLLYPILEKLCAEKKLVKEGGGYSAPGQNPLLKGDDDLMAQKLLAFAELSGFVPFSASRFCTETPGHWNEDRAGRMLHFLNNQGRLIRLSNKRFVSVDAMETIKRKVKEIIEKRGSVRLSDSQELLGYGRTMAVPVFEYLDSVGLTRREGEGRVLAEPV